MTTSFSLSKEKKSRPKKKYYITRSVAKSKYSRVNIQRDEDLQKLEEYIKFLLEEDYVNARVRKQIKDFREEYGYSYSGMLKSLIYFYEVKGNSKEKAKASGGIGIVPFIYEQAKLYYFNLFMAQNQNETKDIITVTSKVKEITIKAPHIEKPLKRLFNLDDDDIEEFNNEQE